VDTPIRGTGRSKTVTRTQLAALTLIAATVVIGTLVFGVLRLYAS
jgi:hypothetical protein